MLDILLKTTFGIVLLQFIMTIIFLGIPYLNIKRIGLYHQKEKYVNEKSFNIHYGFKIGLYAMLPLYITIVMLVLMKIELIPDMVYLYRILNPQFSGFLYFLLQDASIVNISWVQVIIISILPLSIPLVVGIGYLHGYKDRSWI